MKYYFFLILITIVAVIIALKVNPVNNGLSEQLAKRNLLKCQLEDLQEEVESLKRELYDMKNNPFSVEKYAREEFGHAGQKEFIFKFK